MGRRLMMVAWAMVVGVALSGAAQAVELGVTDGLVLWLKADSIPGLSGGQIFEAATTTVWPDQATGAIGDGISQDAILSDGGPTLQNNIVAGQPGVRFGGGGALQSTTPLGISGQAAWTAFYVGTADNNADARILQFGDIDTGTGGASVGLDIGKGGFRYNDGNSLHANDAPDTFPNIAAWRMTAANTYGGATGPDYFLNGVAGTETGNGSPNKTINLTDEGYLLGRGLLGNGSVGNWMKGDMGEVLLYNRALSDAELDQVHAYLKQRYGIAPDRVPGVDLTSLANVSAFLAPPNITEGSLEHNVEGALFLEQKSLILPQDIEANHVAPGTDMTDHGDVDGVIPAGTMVNSHYLSFDPATNPGSAIASGLMQITFDWPIIGVLTANAQLNASDLILGANGTTYLDGNVGLEAGDDMLTISADRKTLWITMNASSNNLDQIRVLTAVPEPATLSLLGLGLLPILRRRRR